MNKRVLSFSLLLLALPAQAHHTKDHVLGAPPPAVSAPAPEPAAPSASKFWLALGPFFLLAGIGVIRWGYRRRHDRNPNAPD